MNRSKLVFGIVALAAALALAAPVMAQSIMRMEGQVLGLDGKPFPGVTVVIKNEQGQTWEVKTDEKGNFSQGGLRGGIYILTFKVKDQQVYEMNWRLQAADDRRIIVNFKEIAEKQGAAQAEAMKKQEEERNKFEAMKTHFEAGRAALDQARAAQAEANKAPADQKAALRQKADEFSQTAIAQFSSAQQAADPKDDNLHLVVANLGQAYETAGKWSDAEQAWAKAIELRPAEASYVIGYGNSLARQGKATEAGAACDKIATLAPANSAMCWRNLGIVLYNTSKYKEAIEPLQKATKLEPNSAQAWYVLGASMVGAAEWKKEGDTVKPILIPGTVEAYQKCLDLDPNGPYGAQAKEGLAQLEALGAGIQTKVRGGKKRP